ncbi:MAG: superoxide dismutase [Candidatus Riflebacteria bacterium]|nr:superoxide dismutase [Candidatus Riflebacteria bacterium]
MTLFITAFLLGVHQPVCAQEKKPIIQEPLPYSQNALEPFISSYTLGFHYGKHHAAYVDKANELLEKSPLAKQPVEEIIKATAGKADQTILFNNVAQAWNHSFFWKCLKAQGGGKPGEKLAKLIDENFGSFDKFKEEFINAGKAQFGSGWVWLVSDGGKLKIVKTPNADNPIVNNQKPLFVVDVWEHSYYLDYQNRRPDYIKAILEHLANWEFVTSNL